MVQRDYLMRTVQQLAHMLAALFGGQRGRHLAETMERLDAISATFTGLDLPTLRSFGYEHLHAILSASGELAVERAYAAARVLHADTKLAAERGAGFSVSQALTTYRLLVDVTNALGGYVDEHHEDALLELDDALKGHLVSAEVAEQAFRAFRSVGRFDRAEDALFTWLERDPDARVSAESFYGDLLGLPEAELDRGRLPRREVLEALHELGIAPCHTPAGGNGGDDAA